MSEPKFIISQGLLQAVIDYLATRPYKEVAGALPQLMGLPPVPEKEENEPDTRGS